MNAEIAPNQWELQVCSDVINASDSLLLTRYILERTAEENNLGISYHPKPLNGNWNGSGCHTNYSTESMRTDDKLKNITRVIEGLGKNHEELLKDYGAENKKRMTSSCYAANSDRLCQHDRFVYGVGDRSASVRIPVSTNKDGRGYIEDRRPASNIDPYVVSRRMVETTLNV
jgi:glutamine synthetase